MTTFLDTCGLSVATPPPPPRSAASLSKCRRLPACLWFAQASQRSGPWASS